MPSCACHDIYIWDAWCWLLQVRTIQRSTTPSRGAVWQWPHVTSHCFSGSVVSHEKTNPWSCLVCIPHDFGYGLVYSGCHPPAKLNTCQQCVQQDGVLYPNMVSWWWPSWPSEPWHIIPCLHFRDAKREQKTKQLLHELQTMQHEAKMERIKKKKWLLRTFSH